MQTFVLGHKNPDTDSVIAAIAQAALMKINGEFAVPCVQDDPNPESRFVLKKFNLPEPEKISSVGGKKVVLVDTNDPAQLPLDIRDAVLRGIVDHHQLAGGIATPGPIYINCRPYGCTCTIIAREFANKNIPIDKNMAGGMLCAILSDTIMFKSPTTTPEDREVAEKLAEIANVNMMSVGMEMLKIKSDISRETAATLLGRDLKRFTINDRQFIIAQIELIDNEMFDPFVADMQREMAALRAGDKELSGVIMVVTDIMKEGSMMILDTAHNERIKGTFKHNATEDKNIIFVPGLLSRKKQVVPALTENL